MSKRNFILLILILIVAVIAVFGILYIKQGKIPTIEDTGGINFLSQFNPFKNSTKTTPTGTSVVDVSGYQPPAGTETPQLQLMKVSSMPVSGYGVYSKERLIDTPTIVPISTESSTTTKTISKPTPPLTEFVPVLRYVERSTGNIYQTFVDKIEERKASDTIIPKVYEAYITNHGESAIMRYLQANDSTIETFIGTLPKEYIGSDTTSNSKVTGSFLPKDTKDVSISPDTSKVFYLFMSGNSIIGTTLNLLDNKKVQVFDSPFTEWLSQWPNSNIITLSTKPSANVLGYMYTIDLSSKNFTKVLGNINGLTTLTSPDGKLILYGDNNLSLYVNHTDNKNSDALSLRTLPEKCVWARNSAVVYCAVPKLINLNSYPDAWYQGEESFNDQIWKIDIDTGNATLIIDPATIGDGEEIDAIKLSLDESENHLLFVNKKDLFLWKLDLK